MSAPAVTEPLIIGHRGAAAVVPENTLAAFRRALADGADGIEFDVRLARDGVPVVIHDRSLKRTGLTAALVSELSSSDLGQIDVGTWFNLKRPAKARARYAKECVPTLAQVFGCLQSAAPLFYLELKCEGRESGDLAARVVDSIRAHSLAGRVIVESFDLGAIEEVKLLDAEIKTAALFEPKLWRPLSMLRKMRLVQLARAAGAAEIALHHTLASRRLIEAARDSGLSVTLWTVDNPDWLARARSAGIRALITNDPARLLGGRPGRAAI